MKEYQHQPDDRTAAIRRRRDLVRQSDAMRKAQAKKEAATIQPKLEISAPGDKHEQEADAVAKAVVTGSDAQLNLQQSQNDSRMHAMRAAGYGDEEIGAYTSEQDEQTTATPHVQKKEEEEEKGALMAKGEDGGLKGTTELQAKLDASKGSGQALDDKTRGEMEGHMGADLGDVKIHTGSHAHEMADGINARAFTHGQDIYFKNGNYNTNSPEGKELLAHELTHTQQQKQGVERKVQRSVELSVVRGLLKIWMYSQPTTYLVQGLLSLWKTIPEEERIKMVNTALDKKIAELKKDEGADVPSWVKMASAVLSGGPSLMPTPSLETIWPLLITGELGYFTYLRNVSNKYVKPEDVVKNDKAGKEADTKATDKEAPPPGMVKNPNYVKGGYAAVLEKQMENMIDPEFALGEIAGVFEGIYGWFEDIVTGVWDMLKLVWSGIQSAWKTIQEMNTTLTTGKPPEWWSSSANLQKTR